MSSINTASPLSAINSAFKSTRPQTALGTDRDATGQSDPDAASGTTGTGVFSPLQSVQSATQNVVNIAHGISGGTATLSDLLAAIRAAVASGQPTTSTPPTPPSIGPAKPPATSNPKSSAASGSVKASGTAVFKGTTDSAPVTQSPGTVVHTDPVTPTVPAPSGSKTTGTNSPTTSVLPATGISDGAPTTPTSPTSPQPFSPISSVQQATHSVVDVAQSVAGGKATLSDLIAAIIKAQQSSRPAAAPTDPVAQQPPIPSYPSTPTTTPKTNPADAQASAAATFPAGSFVDAAA